MRIQTAKPGGELRRKHVYRALREIHRRRALVRLAIEPASLAHVMRDVGDVDAQPIIAVRQLFDRDRIVEIARVLSVDRDRHETSEIGAVADIRLEYAGAETQRFANRSGRMLI